MQPKIYHFKEHGIAPEHIDEHAYEVIMRLRQAGHLAYLVGGGIRDLLLKRTPKDFDVSTSARPEEVRALFRNALLIGRRFRLAHIRFGKKVIEVSTFRSGATEEAGLITRDNEWGSEEEDVLRRDFTINGLFYDPEHQTVIDYVGGYQDLEKRLLRTIGEPNVRFMQDPVRMIRLVKFCARFDLKIDPPTFEALLNCKGEILKSSSARILEELLRMLESGASKPFFHLLHEYGLLKPLSPDFAEYIEYDKHGALKLLEHADDEVKKEGSPDRAVLLAGLLYPLFSAGVAAQDKTLNFGHVQNLAHRAVDIFFSPFLQLPKRIRWMTTTILATQYRIHPPDGKERRPRVPRDPLFPMAMKLLKIRTSAHPELLPAYTLWSEASFGIDHGEIPPPDRRPRRRRRRR